MEVLGVPAGSVTPFALINDKARRVTVILDADMMRHERLNYHPLENTATTNIAREDLVAVHPRLRPRAAHFAVAAARRDGAGGGTRLDAAGQHSRP